MLVLRSHISTPEGITAPSTRRWDPFPELRSLFVQTAYTAFGNYLPLGFSLFLSLGRAALVNWH